MNWLELKYIGLLSNRLRNYKRKSNNLINFSCPLCGDSENDQRKARGYVYQKNGISLFHCHNCTVTMKLDKFLKTIDFQLYTEYVMERMKDAGETIIDVDEKKFIKPVFENSTYLKKLKKISQLSPNNTAKKYISDRKIPNYYHSQMYVCKNFPLFVNDIITGKFSEKAIKNGEPRIIIPFFNKNKQMHAFQGRALGDIDPRMKYITIVTDESELKVWGLNNVDFNRKTYVFEGPFDAMFIPNSIATAGGDLVSTIYNLNKKNLVIVYDNEPRSMETKKKIEKAILNGYSVCIWNSNNHHKDVNDMILNGMTADMIKFEIDQNTYSGLQATIALKNWSKV